MSKQRGMLLDDENMPNDDWGFKGNNYLLAIGIDKYTVWKPLNNAVKDAKDFVNVLKTNYQFEEPYIHTLFDEQATEDSIHEKMLELVKLIQEDDNLLIYFSGHGHYINELDQGYWVPVHAPKTDTASRYISNSDIVNFLHSIKSKHTFLIVDSCFSGSLMTPLKGDSLRRAERKKSRRIFTSGRKEVVEDGSPGQNSPFAAGILAQLKSNNLSILKTTALIENVKTYLEKEDVKQTPDDMRIKRLGDDGGEFIFYLKKSDEEIWKDLNANPTIEGFQKYVDFKPLGKYVDEAQDMILALKEDGIWETTQRRNNATAYNDYIQQFPNGKYSAKALELLESIDENTEWADALRKNSLSGFMSYLIKYPNGSKAADANQRIERLKATQQESSAEATRRQEELDGLIKREEGLVAQKKRYRKRFEEAEQLFAAKKYGDAKIKYLQCQKEYQKGFEPDGNFLKNRIIDSEKYDELGTLYKSGKKAHDEGNYDLAIHYYEKAYAIHQSPKLTELIRLASAKTQGGKRLQKSVNVQKKAKAKSSGSGFGKVILYGLAAVGGIVGLLVLIGLFAEDPMPTPASQPAPIPAPGVNPEPTPAPAPAPRAINYADRILGDWQVIDVDIDNSVYQNMINGAFYSFGIDGIVYENMTTQWPYFVNGNQLNFANGILLARMSFDSDGDLILKGTYNVQYAGSYPIEITMERVQ